MPTAAKRAAKRKTKRAHRATLKASTAISTGDVAEILEDKYHLFEVFYELHAQRIADMFAESAAGALESVLLGAPASLRLTADAGQEIETRFKDAISAREYDNFIPNVPTAAARKGINHRLIHPYAKANPERPSFRDTGLLQASFKAWTTSS